MTTPSACSTLHFEVVVAGGGFAGAYCARTLARALGKDSGKRVCLIADQNVLVFQPMLAEVVGGSLQPDDVVAPLRQFCKGVNVLLGAIEAVDVKEKLVELDLGHFTPNTNIRYQQLVLALGNIVDQTRVPGMTEHGFVLKDAWDAVRLRTGILERMEEANLCINEEARKRLLTFVVVGGGYSGVETAGQILDLIHCVKKFYFNLVTTPHRVILIHSRDFLLPEIGEKLGRYAEQKLRERGMEVVLNQRVASVTARKVVLANGDSYETHFVVSTVGNAPNPIVTDLCKQESIPSEKGRIKTERSMQVVGHPDIWALGDCAAVPDGDQPTCPPTAQFALRQGLQAGANIVRVINGQPTQPFHHVNQGQLAAIGHQAAVADIMGFKFSGFIAWVIWRVIYLSKLPGMKRQVQVIFDWILELFFSRDVAILRFNTRHSIEDMHFEPGDAVYHAGEPYISFYIVKRGSVQCTLADGSVVKMNDGDLMGGKNLTNDQTWTSTAIVTEPATLISVRRAVMKRLLESKELARRLKAEDLADA